MEDSNTIKFCTENGTNEVMRLDKDGMIYKGKRIEDGGEAYKAFLDVMIAREEERADRPVKEKYYWIAGYYSAMERYADHLEAALARERESVNELSEANQRLEKQAKFDKARIRILARKASASWKEIEEEIYYLNHEEEVFAAQRQDRIKELDAEVKRLKASISKIVSIGHNNDCLFCGFKDLAAKKAMEEG